MIIIIMMMMLYCMLMFVVETTAAAPTPMSGIRHHIFISLSLTYRYCVCTLVHVFYDRFFHLCIIKMLVYDSSYFGHRFSFHDSRDVAQPSRTPSLSQVGEDPPNSK